MPSSLPSKRPLFPAAGALIAPGSGVHLFVKESRASAEPSSREAVQRILVIGRDQLIRSGLRYDVDFIPTGRSHIPDAPLGYAPTLFTRVEYLWDYIRGRYRYAVVSAPEPGSLRARLLAPEWVRHILRRLRPKGTMVALLDTSERRELPTEALTAFAPDICWKLHLSTQTVAPEGVAVRLLPCWVYPPALGWTRRSWKARSIDIFLPPGPDTPARRQAALWLERLRKEKKLRVHIASSDLSDAERHELLGLSRLVLSPVGEAFHTSAHYQAMLHGAIPLINRPEALETTLIQGENALFYTESEEAFREIALWSTSHDDELEILARQAREHAQQYHTPSAVSKALLEAVHLPPEE